MKTFLDQLITLDFAILLRKPKQEAMKALRSILCDCEALQKQVETAQTRLFNVLMCAARVSTEMELYRLEDDPETGYPFTNVEDWIVFHCPKCAGYAEKANKIQMNLPKATLPQLEAMKECNGELLGQYVSSEEIKNDSAVIDATATMTEKEFRKHLNDKGQHISKPMTPLKSMSEEKATLIQQAFDVVLEKMSKVDPAIETREDAAWYWAIDYLDEAGRLPRANQEAA